MKIEEPSGERPGEGFELSRDGIRIEGARRASDVLLVLTAGAVHLFSRVIDNAARSIVAQLAIMFGLLSMLAGVVYGVVSVLR
jgi:hypothetical protein